MIKSSKTDSGKFERSGHIYWFVGIGLIIGFRLVQGLDWHSNAEFHTVLESLATALAFTVGVMSLVRYYTLRETLYLFVGSAFLGTSFLDGFHTLVTSTYFGPMMPSELSSLIPWSWVSSRLFLSIFMVLTCYVLIIEGRSKEERKFNDRRVYASTIVFTSVSFLFFVFVPLPRAYYPELFFSRWEDLLPGLLFTIALIGFLRRNKWRDEGFEYWLVWFLVVGMLSQTVFMPFSTELFDMEFDAAHILKKASYLCVLGGLLISMSSIFQKVQVSSLALETEVEKDKKAVLELSLSNEALRKWEMVFEHAGWGVIIIDAHSDELISVNPAYARMHGYDVEEIRQFKSGDLLAEKDRSLFRTRVKEIHRKGHLVHELTHVRKNGSLFPVLTDTRTIYDENGRILYRAENIQDITVPRQKEEKLKKILNETENREREQRCMHNVVEALRVAETLRDVFDEVVSLIPQGFHLPEIVRCKILFDGQEYASEPVVGTGSKLSSPIVVANEQRGMVEVYYAQAGPQPDESPFSPEERDFLNRIAQALVEAVLLHESETERRRLIAAVEQASDSIVITDTEGTIVYVNPLFEKITGYSREEAIGKNPRILKSGEQDAAFYENLWDTLSSGRQWNGHIVNKRKDGSLYTDEVVISPVRDASGKTINYVAVQRDVTQDLKGEEQLRQSQKMESIGQLAGGVAHDFNNMLGIIVGHTEMILDQMEVSEPHYSALTQIRVAAERSSELTTQLLAFARKQSMSPKILDLNDTIGGMLKIFRSVVGEQIDLAWNPGDGELLVHMDPLQIEHVMANIIVNARDAITGTGKVAITTELITLAGDEADYAGTSGVFVLLSVRDDGCGMSKATASKIFDPFFTTKPLGESTGLGLSSVFGIVKQNHGFINVKSEPGKGATIEICLPFHESAADEPTGGDGELIVETATETILVVEDEPALLEMITSMLEIQGYSVVSATSPGGAIEIMESREHDIDLLLTDVIMPGMNGGELAKQLLADHPELKCLFMSGYTADIIGQQGKLEKDVHFIEKPFVAADLSAGVREALGKN